uniref:Uncharacterized protein n=1 Tax=Arundo donax TaxID=35708 RepID=A0A0A9G697_ARUDO
MVTLNAAKVGMIIAITACIRIWFSI